MTGLTDEWIRARRKRTIRWAAGLFTASLLLLTFFSNTYQSLTLPKVSVEKPATGQLSYTIEGEGVISPKRTVPLFDKSGWDVKEVLVEEGDTVTKGQTLIVFDPSEAERSLADEQDRSAKLQLELARLLEELKQSGIGGDSAKIDAVKRSIELLKLDISIQSRKLDHLRKEMEEQRTLAAPFDGLILSLNVDEGLSVSPGKAVAEVSESAQGWILEASVDAQAAERLAMGETMDVRIRESKPRYVKGTVAAVANVSPGGTQGQGGAADKKTVTLEISDPALQGNELADFQLNKKSGMPRPLVPLSAVHQDSEGEYILTVQETKKPLGNEFRVQKSYVQVEDSDETNAAVKSPLKPDEKIVMESSEPLSDGDQVRLD